MPQDRVTYWERIFSQQLARLRYPYIDSKARKKVPHTKVQYGLFH